MQGGVYERKAGVYKDAPEVVLRAQVTRKPYWRGLRYSVWMVLAGVAVWYLPLLPGVIADVNPLVSLRWQQVALNIGRLVAALLVIYGAARLVVMIVQLVLRKPERVIFYDQGFVWQARDERNKYSWRAVKTVIEDPHAWIFRGKVRFQWGHITLKMRDGNTYRYTAAHGSLLAFLRRVRPLYAAEQGTRMGQMLRLNKSFQVHPQLRVAPPGLIIDGKKQVSWQRLKIDMTERELLIKRVDDAGNIQPVRGFPLKQIENLGGFLDLTESLTETFQRPNPYA